MADQTSARDLENKEVEAKPSRSKSATTAKKAATTRSSTATGRSSKTTTKSTATKSTAKQAATKKVAAKSEGKASTDKADSAATKARKSTAKAAPAKSATKKTAVRKAPAKQAEPVAVEPTTADSPVAAVVDMPTETAVSIDLSTAIDISDTATEQTEAHVVDVDAVETMADATAIAPLQAAESQSAESLNGQTHFDVKNEDSSAEVTKPRTRKTTSPRTTASKKAPAAGSSTNGGSATSASKSAPKTAKRTAPKRQPRKPVELAAAAAELEEKLDTPVVEDSATAPTEAGIPDPEPIDALDEVLETSENTEVLSQAESRLEGAIEASAVETPMAEADEPSDAPSVLTDSTPEASLGDVVATAPVPRTERVFVETVPSPGGYRRSTATIVTVIATAVVAMGAGLLLGSRANQPQSTYTSTTNVPATTLTTAPVGITPSTSADGSTITTLGASAGGSVTRLSGTANRQSAPFNLPQGPVKVRYNTTSGTLTVRLLTTSGQDTGDDFVCTSACDREADLVKDAGSYYLDIQSAGGNWNITVNN